MLLTKKIKSKIIEKKNIVLTATLLWMLLSTIGRYTVFGMDSYNSKSLPMDYDSVWLYVFMAKAISYCFVYLVVHLIFSIAKEIKKGNKLYIRKFLLPLGISFTVLGFNMILLYPGYWWGDDAIIYAMATQYLPLYWHNYLTSLWYMVSFNVLPLPYAPIIVMNLLAAIGFSALYYENAKSDATKRCYLLYLLFSPYVLFTITSGSRITYYSIIHAFLFLFLLLEYRKQEKISGTKIVILVIASGVVTFWRSEGMPYLVLLPVIVYVIYRTSLSWKKFMVYLVGFWFLFMILSIPQKMGEEKFYHKDYFIPNTTRSLSVILSREQTYEGAKEDIENINTIIPIEFIQKNYLNVSYQEWNDCNNQGKLTQTGASKETQEKYIGSYVSLVLHNLDLFLWERFQCFFEANNLQKAYEWFNIQERNTQATSTGNRLEVYEKDVEAARNFQREIFLRNAKPNETYFGAITFSKLPKLWALSNYVLPSIIILIIIGIAMLWKKRYVEALLCVTILSREALVFAVRPDSRMSYGTTTIITAYFLLVGWITFRRKEKEEKNGADGQDITIYTNV